MLFFGNMDVNQMIINVLFFSSSVNALDWSFKLLIVFYFKSTILVVITPV